VNRSGRSVGIGARSGNRSVVSSMAIGSVEWPQVIKGFGRSVSTVAIDQYRGNRLRFLKKGSGQMGHCGDDKWKLDKCRFDWTSAKSCSSLLLLAFRPPLFFFFNF
jgi:hypothetical protein